MSILPIRVREARRLSGWTQSTVGGKSDLSTSTNGAAGGVRLKKEDQLVKGIKGRAHGVKAPIEFERFDSHRERYVPHPYAKDGLYRMGDPFLDKKHHAANQISVQANEIEDYLRRGFHLRMRGEVRGQVNMIDPLEITKIVR